MLVAENDPVAPEMRDHVYVLGLALPSLTTVLEQSTVNTDCGTTGRGAVDEVVIITAGL
jgi:hypothetical protein